MMRQESPSPNSTLSNSALAAAKPPTPTSSPKLMRKRTYSGGSGDQSIVRQHLDIENDIDDRASVKSKRGQVAGRRDSPSDLHFGSPNTSFGQYSGQNNAAAGVPVVHDKRRSSTGGTDQSAWPETGGGPPSSPTSTRSEKVHQHTSSRDQKEPISPTRNRIEASSSPVNHVNSTSASPTSAVENQKTGGMSMSTSAHAQPVISGIRRSRIPQPTSGANSGQSVIYGNGCVEHDIDAYKAELSVTDPHTPLYSPRQLNLEEVRSSDEQLQISYDVSAAGNQLRVVRDQEFTPFRSHPVDRCGVVVPSGPSSIAAKQHDMDLERGRQGSPNNTGDSNGSGSGGGGGGKKTAPPRVIDFEKNPAESKKPISFSQRHKMNRNRSGSLRHNVQVLPDKKLLRDKANSNENLSAAVGDVALGETFVTGPAPGPAAPQTVSPVPPAAERLGGSGGGSGSGVSLLPRPPMTKRPSTDSDDNSAPESDHGRATGNGNASLPPRGRLALYSQKKKNSAAAAAAAAANGGTNGHSTSSASGATTASGGGHQGRSAPILIGGGGSSRRDNSPCTDPGSILLNSARPDDSSDGESINDDCPGGVGAGGNTSDGDISPKGSTSGGGGGERSLPSSRQKSSSLEVLCAENPTVPKICQPSARRSSRQQQQQGPGGVPGSPPKSVTWNPILDVVNFDKDLTPDPGADNHPDGPFASSPSSSSATGSAAASSSSSSSSRHHHHHHSHHRHKSDIPFSSSSSSSHSHRHQHSRIRHAASDERLFDARKGIANSTLIAVHETFLEQMTMLLKEEMQLLEEVKQEKKPMQVYREVMRKILSIKAKTVKQMQDILEQSDV